MEVIKKLVQQIEAKKSFLCVGLDVDLEKVPPHILEEEDPIFAFNKAIIDATHQLAVAYKPNTAFYEAYGISGWRSLEKTINYLNDNHPDIACSHHSIGMLLRDHGDFEESWNEHHKALAIRELVRLRTSGRSFSLRRKQ